MTASAIAFTASCPTTMPALPGDIRNLLQIAASAFHLIDLQVDDGLRPLVRIGLAAIHHAAGGTPAPDTTLQATGRIS